MPNPIPFLRGLLFLLLFFSFRDSLYAQQGVMKRVYMDPTIPTEYSLIPNFTEFRIIPDPAEFIRSGADTAGLSRLHGGMTGKEGNHLWLLSTILFSDSLIGNIVPVRVTENGYSMIFIGGKLMYNSGDVTNPDNREMFIKSGQYRNMFFLKVTSKRMMVLTSFTYQQKFPFIRFSDLNEKTELYRQQNRAYEDYFALGCTFILFSFGVLFLFLFLYSRDLVYNLYFSLFAFSVAAVIFYGLLSRVLHLFHNLNDPVRVVFTCAIVISLLLFLRKYIELKSSRISRILLLIVWGLLVTTIVLAFMPSAMFNNPPFLYTLTTLIFVGSFDAVRTVVLGLKGKKREARTTGVAFLLSLLLFLGTAFFDVIFETVSWNGAFSYQTILFSVSACVFPFFMALNLAGDFSRKNKQLAEQVDTIRDLSEKNLQKEREKQEIILKQNEMLELQVKERTKEITLQKELIEAKQKEILDSIHYARRIQKALITSEKYISRRLGRLVQ